MDILEFEKKYEIYLCDNYDLICSCLKDGDTFVDIGANTGLLSKRIYDTISLDKIYLFEPVVELVESIQNKFNGYDNVEIIQYGVSNQPSIKELYISEKNYAYNKIYVEGMHIDPHRKESIECIKFSDWVGDKKIDFIKIDVEGHDIEVIEGMFDWLDCISTKPYILFEGGWYLDREDKLISKMVKEYQYTYKKSGRDNLLIPPIVKQTLI
jgi:FkbM family methyltransferase